MSEANQEEFDLDTDNEASDVRPDELTLLKQRAKMMGIQFSNNIGIDSLKTRIAEKMEASTVTVTDGSDDADEQELSAMPEVTPMISPDMSNLNPLLGDVAGEAPVRKLSLRERCIKDAMRLVRCRITNMDPKKKDLPGEVISVGNRYIGTVRKYIPYGEVTDDGYHIPKVLYDELNSRQFLHVRVTKDRKTGRPVVNTSYAKEFALEVLPQLTPDELAKLANAQLAASNT